MKGLFLIIFSIILFAQCVSANFICGEVLDAENAYADWFSVNAFYSDNPLHSTSCQVSPSNNRFCCDPSSISEVQWAIGKGVTTEMFDSDSGFFIVPETTIISGQGYDVAPQRHLKEAIKFNSKIPQLILERQTLPLNVSSDEYFSSFSYSLHHNGMTMAEDSCTSCNSFETALNLPEYGKYELVLTASNSIKSMSKKVSFYRLENFRVIRSFNCDGCFEDFVPRGTNVSVTLSLELSEPAEAVFTDHFPIDWRFISSQDGDLSEYSQTHRMISWEINGTTAQKTYSLASPNNLAPKRHAFFASLGDYSAQKEIIYTFGLLRSRILSFPEDFVERTSQLDQRANLLVSPSSPAVISGEVEVAIFPNKEIRSSFSSLIKEEDVYTIDSTIRDSQIEKIIVRYKVEKEANDSFRAHDLVSNSFLPVSSEVYKEDSAYEYRQVILGKKSKFIIGQ